MKKIIFIAIAVALFILCGCNGVDMSDKENGQVVTKYYNVVELDVKDKIMNADYNGHRYIIWKSYQKGGIIHDESCPCKR